MLSDYKDIHDGERIFILGNGPSLNKVPLNLLENEYTMALNKISYIYDQTSWRPTYYVFYDFATHEKYGIETSDELIESVKDSVKESDVAFISKPGKKHLQEASDIEYFEPKDTNNKVRRKDAIQSKDVSEVWYQDITNGIYNFGSTISVTAQIASYMGFDQIYFLGTDLYEIPNPYMIFQTGNDPGGYRFSTNSTILKYNKYISNSSAPFRDTLNVFLYKLWLEYKNILPKLKTFEGDANHFTDEYDPDFSHDPRWKNRQLSEVHEVIEVASEKYDFEVYNATTGGNLEVHKRVDLDSIL